MTDGVASRSFFCLNTAQKLPEIEQYYPNTTLKLLPNPPKIRVVSEGRETARIQPERDSQLQIVVYQGSKKGTKLL